MTVLQVETDTVTRRTITAREESIERFHALQKEWNELLERSRTRTIFLTWEWLHAWWCHFSEENILKLITVRDEAGRLLGIGPFCVARKGTWLPRRVLTFLGTTRISSEYLDIVADPRHEAEVVAAIFDHLSADSSWDSAELTDLRETALVKTAFASLARTHGWLVSYVVSQICPYLPLPANREALYALLSRQMRETLRRRTRKLQAQGAVLRVVETPEELTAALPMLFSLHQQRWNLRGGTGNFEDAPIREFHQTIARHFLELGWLRLYTLASGEAPMACLYAFQYGRTLSYYQSGFDPAASAQSPGLVLMGQCLEDAVARGLMEFDYLRGTETYKQRWTKTTRNTWILTIIPSDHWRHILRFYTQHLYKQLKTAGKTILHHTRLKRMPVAPETHG